MGPFIRGFLAGEGFVAFDGDGDVAVVGGFVSDIGAGAEGEGPLSLSRVVVAVARKVWPPITH